jgi:hypothetical protein
MRSYKVHFQKRSAQLLIAIVPLLFGSPARAKITDHVTGSYKIKNVTQLGREVRVTLQVRLINGGDRDLSNSRASLYGLAWNPQPRAVSSPLVFHAHSMAEVSYELTIPRQVFERWRRGARLLLFLEIPRTGGRTSTVLIHLIRNSGWNGE